MGSGAAGSMALPARKVVWSIALPIGPPQLKDAECQDCGAKKRKERAAVGSFEYETAGEAGNQKP